MGLMTERIAKTKKCKERELTKILQMAMTFYGAVHGNRKSAEMATVIERDGNNCEGRACMHWNFTDKIDEIPPEDLDDEGNLKPEILGEAGWLSLAEYQSEVLRTGYCGLSAPIEEIEFQIDQTGGAF